MQKHDLLATNDMGFYLPGLRLTHIFRLRCIADTAIPAKVAMQLQAAEVLPDRWDIMRRGDTLDQKIIVADISEELARTLRQNCATLDPGVSVRLEHMFCKGK